MRKTDRNIIIATGFVKDGDAEAMFGDASGEIDGEIEIWPKETIWPDLLEHQFGSRSQVRKAGWYHIPYGFTDVTVGKLKHRFTVWKPEK